MSCTCSTVVLIKRLKKKSNHGKAIDTFSTITTVSFRGYYNGCVTCNLEKM